MSWTHEWQLRRSPRNSDATEQMSDLSWLVPAERCRLVNAYFGNFWVRKVKKSQPECHSLSTSASSISYLLAFSFGTRASLWTLFDTMKGMRRISQWTQQQVDEPDMSFILIGWSMRTLFALLVMPLVCPNIRSSPQSHIYIDTERPKHISNRKLAKK